MNDSRNFSIGFNPNDVAPGRIPAVDHHIHTNWTDGEHSAEGMYQEACEKGLTQILFSEHSRESSTDWFNDFATEIRALPATPCRALVGAECKIKDLDGNLDTAPEISALCDSVMASVHRFPGADGKAVPFEETDPNQAAEMEFELSWQALANPLVDILGHPFGMAYRRFGVTPPESLIRKLMERAVAHDVTFEINSYYHPDPWRMIELCRETGTRISLGSNAHSRKDLGQIVRTLRGEGEL